MNPPPGFNPRNASALHADRESSYPPTRSVTGPAVSILDNANNTLISNSSFNLRTNNNITNNFSSAASPLDLLYRSVAPNAILNSGGRADEVRCYPGTREEVIGLVEKSIAQEYDGPRMLWLSGPAGAGKSAIMQTVAERCEEQGVPHANFFFFRADKSRADARAFVATLMHQIIKLYPSVAPAVAAALASDPILLQMGLHQQFDALLQKAFVAALDPPPFDLQIPPITLLIDGLDECDSEAKIQQRQILLALDHLLVQNGPHFRVVVASRVEPQISMAFKQLRCQVDSIFLDEQYSPEQDIRIFVTAEFEKIKLIHYLANTLRPDWPSDSDIDAIVSKSSGQFIYAATVMRFIAHSPASPVLSLKKIQGIVLPAKNTPFAHLDGVYTYILSQVDDLEAAKIILAIRLLGRIRLQLLKLTVAAHKARFSEEVFDSCISELSSIVDPRNHLLYFFHASFPDFLRDKTRAGIYHIDLGAFCTAALPIWWASEFRCMDVSICGGALDEIHQPTPVMTAALMVPHPDILEDAQSSSKFQNHLRLEYIDGMVNRLHRIYAPHDPESFAKIMDAWGCSDEILNKRLEDALRRWNHGMGGSAHPRPTRLST